MTKEETYRYLSDHKLSYEVTEHQAVFNMAELGAVKLPYPELDAKNLFVRDDKREHQPVKKYIQGGIGGRSPLITIRPSDMCGGAEGLA